MGKMYVLLHIKIIYRCCCYWLLQCFALVFTRFPWLTLSISAVIVFGLGVGAIFMEITTDPVELWAGPHSRSRAEKDFFDEKFGPFYRTAQVFIKPIYKEHVIWAIHRSHSQWNRRLTVLLSKYFTDQAWYNLWNFGKCFRFIYLFNLIRKLKFSGV